MALVRRALAAATCLLLGACAADDEGELDDLMMTVDGPIPDNGGNEVLDWLMGGGYLDWTAESAIHAGAGPHFGSVRTFVNDELFGSLQAGDEQHPAGAAAVKELYGSGTSLLGWTTMVKTADDSADGDNWYWFEYYQGDALLDSAGAAVCTGCHGGGTDFFLSPFPLQ